MKDLLYFYSKDSHFTLNIKTYVQVDGVDMRSAIGSVLAKSFYGRA